MKKIQIIKIKYSLFLLLFMLLIQKLFYTEKKSNLKYIIKSLKDPNDLV
jgi:hypothetical protein